MSDISKIQLPNGNIYTLKDEAARTDIQNLKTSVTGAMHYIGVTTTAITDKSDTSDIEIQGKDSVIVSSGDVVIYQDKEFVWDGTQWNEFGDMGSLKALAFKSDATAQYTPQGTITAPVFNGTEKNLSFPFTPSGTVTIAEGLATTTQNYTPAGTVSAPKTTVTLNTTTIEPMDKVGTLPTCKLPTFTTNVEEETLILNWTDGQYTQGTLPTKGQGVSVATGVLSATTAAPTFTGTPTNLTATFSGTAGNVTGKYTPEGTIDAPTFNGTSATITVK